MNQDRIELMQDLRSKGVEVSPLNDYAIQISGTDERVIVTVDRNERGLSIVSGNSRRSKGARAHTRQSELDKVVESLKEKGYMIDHAFESPRIKW